MRGKRILALILTLSMALSLLPFVFVYAEDETVSKYELEIEFLTTLGIFNEDFVKDEVITKASMAKMIATMLHPGLDFSQDVDGKNVFNDVTASHEYYSYIKACKQLGVVKGDYSNNFNPDHKITAIEAITMVINALGYTPYANTNGGYPTGYYSVAYQTGISKGIDLSSQEEITGEVAAKIIYNAMFADIVEMKSINSDGVEIFVNATKNILSERLGIFEYDGIVIDNGMTSTEGTSIGDIEKAVIKEVSTGKTVAAYINGTNIASLIGYRVKAFIRNNIEDGRYEYVYVAPHKNYETITINAKDVIDVKSNYVEYDEDLTTSETEKLNLPNGRPTVIYNGIKKIDKPLSELIPNDGFVTFVDNTGDSAYDVVVIYSFNYKDGVYNQDARNIIVDNIIKEDGNEEITCLFNPANNLDLNDDEYDYSFIMNDEYTSIKDLEQGMVVSVAEAPEPIDGKTYYFLAVSNNKFEGSLTGISGNSLMIGEEEYDLSTGLTGVKPNYAKGLKFGETIEIFLDATGKIAYAKTENGSSKNYAYIVKAADRTKANEYVIVKFFNKEGKMLELPISEKAKIDGVNVKGKSAKDIVKLIETRSSYATTLDSAPQTGRPAIIEVRNDEIVRIDTDTPNEEFSSGNLSEDYLKQSPIQYYEEDAESFDTLKAGFRSPRVVEAKDTSKSIGGKFFITSDTVILGVPEIDTYGMAKLKDYRPFGQDTYYMGGQYPPDLKMVQLHELENIDENYKVIKASNVSTTHAYDIQGYDIDPDTGVAGFVVIRGRRDLYRSGEVPYWKAYGMSVFLKKTSVYDEETEETVTKIYYSDRGEEKSAIIDLNKAYFPYKALINGASIGETPINSDFNVESLEEGDIIRVIESDGKLTHIERVLNLDKYKDAGGFVYYPSALPIPYSSAKQTGTRANFPYDMPVPSSVTPNDTYSLITCYAKSVNPSAVKLITTLSPNTNFGSIDITKPDTYSEQFYRSPSGGVVIMNIDNNGKIEQIDVGTITDAVTLDEVSGNIDEASVIIIKLTDAVIEQAFIINGVNNIKLEGN